MSALRGAAGAMLALLLSGCVNVYHRVDAGPEGKPMSFRGIGTYLQNTQVLHVMQIHGMGDHSAANDCGEGSENLKLQGRLAEELDHSLDMTYGDGVSKPIEFDGTLVGTYSVAKYDPKDPKYGTLYFSCVTWGETSRLIKLGMLELDDNFFEKNDNQHHRALINSLAKRFVNQSFSDPVIYQGQMGPFIRRVVWEGMSLAYQAHAERAKRGINEHAQLFSLDRSQADSPPVAIISDSLGSRIVFDSICSVAGGRCGTSQPPAMMAPRGYERSLVKSVQERDAHLSARLRGSIRSVYMLANQLPLLELANLEPPPEGTPLEGWLGAPRECALPKTESVGVEGIRSTNDENEQYIEFVAFTDANDALSYHLTRDFKARCSSAREAALQVAMQSDGKEPPPIDVRFINVTMPNAKARWLFVYSSLGKAHSSGFKDNDRAIDYMVFGNGNQASARSSKP